MAPSVQYRRKNSAIRAAVFCGGPSHSSDALAQVNGDIALITYFVYTSKPLQKWPQLGRRKGRQSLRSFTIVIETTERTAVLL